MGRSKEPKQRTGTLAALLEDKPKRGRPRRKVSRQNVYVALSREQKDSMSELAAYLPKGLGRADLPDLAVSMLAARLEALRRDVADRNREIPEGVTDLESLYLLWDLPLPPEDSVGRWTSVRVSPQQAIELGRAHGTLHAAFGANRTEIFALGLAMLAQFLKGNSMHSTSMTLGELRNKILKYNL